MVGMKNCLKQDIIKNIRHIVKYKIFIKKSMTKISKTFFRFIFIAILSIFEEQKIELPEISVICRILKSFGFLRGVE